MQRKKKNTASFSSCPKAPGGTTKGQSCTKMCKLHKTNRKILPEENIIVTVCICLSRADKAGGSASWTSLKTICMRGSSDQSGSNLTGWWRRHLPAPLGWGISSCPCCSLECSGCCLYDSGERAVCRGWWRVALKHREEPSYQVCSQQWGGGGVHVGFGGTSDKTEEVIYTVPRRD